MEKNGTQVEMNRHYVQEQRSPIHMSTHTQSGTWGLDHVVRTSFKPEAQIGHRSLAKTTWGCSPLDNPAAVVHGYMHLIGFCARVKTDVSLECGLRRIAILVF